MRFEFSEWGRRYVDVLDFIEFDGVAVGGDGFFGVEGGRGYFRLLEPFDALVANKGE